MYCAGKDQDNVWWTGLVFILGDVTHCGVRVVMFVLVGGGA